MKTRTDHRLALLLVLGLTSWLGAQATQQVPSTAPQPYQVVVPPGFARVDFEGRDFILEPADEQWVRGIIERAGPTTGPTTMPSDVLGRFQQQRDALRQRLIHDLAVADPKPIDDYLDGRLGVFLERMDAYRPPLVYLVITPARLKQIVKDGWSDPRFYYNRAADDVVYTSRVSLSLESEDDVVVPLMYNPDISAELREQQIVNQMRAIEQQVLGSVAGETLALTTAGLVELVASLAMPGEDVPQDQEWFVVGVAGVLGARYLSDLSGIERERLLDDLTRPLPSNPVRAETIDLLHPTNLGDLRPEWVRAHLDAYRRRAMSAVRLLLDQADEQALPKLLTAIRQSRPADGAALVELIRQQTGVDLARELSRR